MKAADLDRAVKLAKQRAQHVGLRDRLKAFETLSLFLGEAGHTTEIVMTVAWTEETRRSLIADLDRRIAKDDEALAELGVESDG